MRKGSRFALLAVVLVALSVLVACGTPTTPAAPATTSAPTTAAPAAPAAPATPAAPAAPQTVQISMASIFPLTHYVHTEELPAYFRLVEEAAGGKFKLDIQYFPVGTLLGGAELYDGVVEGIAEAGITSLGYSPGRQPVLQTLTKPGIAPPKSAAAAAAGMWAFYQKFQPKEVEDAKVLYLGATGPGYLHSTKPINSLDDLKGLNIRVTGSGVDGVKAVGGIPIAMPMGDVYEAAQKKIIDANVAPPETLEGWKHHEVFSYSTPFPHFYSEFFWIGMNLQKWNALPKDLQAAFEAVGEEASLQAGRIWEQQQQKALEFAKNSPGGHTFTTLPDTELAKLKELVQPIRDTYIADLNARGLPGQEIVAEAARIMAEANSREYAPWRP